MASQKVQVPVEALLARAEESLRVAQQDAAEYERWERSVLKPYREKVAKAREKHALDLIAKFAARFAKPDEKLLGMARQATQRGYWSGSIWDNVPVFDAEKAVGREPVFEGRGTTTRHLVGEHERAVALLKATNQPTVAVGLDSDLGQYL